MRYVFLAIRTGSEFSLFDQFFGDIASIVDPTDFGELFQHVRRYVDIPSPLYGDQVRHWAPDCPAFKGSVRLKIVSRRGFSRTFTVILIGNK